MKKILGLILILLLGSPWFVGRQIESFYNEVMEDALRENPTLEMTELNYQRGWFTSTVTGGIRIKPMGQEQPLPFEIRYESALTHGPVFWSALSSASPMGLALDASTLWIESTTEDKKIHRILSELPPFKIKSIIGFNKIISTVFKVAEYAKTMEDGKKTIDLKFAGLNGTGSLHWVTRDFDFKAEAPSLTITEGETKKLTIDKLILSAYRKGSDSSARYEIHRFSMENRESNIRVTLDKPYLAGSYAEADEVCNASLESGFDSLAANDLAYAKARLHLKFDNLDKKSLKILKETLDEATANGDAVGSDIYGMMIMGKIMALLPDILKRNPKVTLAALNLGIGNGEALTATGHATILGEKAIKLPSMVLIIQALDAQFEAKLPKAFLNTFLDIGRLMRFMDQGLLVSDGKYYRIDAMVKEGHLIINGNTII